MDESQDVIYTCVDREVPPELRFAAAAKAIEENPANAPIRRPPVADDSHTPFAMALETRALWKPGRTLRIRFMDGDPVVQTKVIHAAEEWNQYGNIKLAFGNDPEAEIRISFKADKGSWSYIGTDALVIPQDKPTMNYGWLTPASTDAEYKRVVLHEFGHALGCIHEHQHPEVSIPWNTTAVYMYYAGPPNFWSKQKVDRNLFQRYSKEETQFSQFDSKSIMLYPVPKNLTVGGFEVGWNRELSETDKKFIGTVYPFETNPAVELVPDAQPTEAEIGEHGEEDLYRFRVTEADCYTIETTGRTDVLMGLYGPDSATELVAEDDDSGRGVNARIVQDLEPGEYNLRVRHYRPKGKGKYRIFVKRGA